MEPCVGVRSMYNVSGDTVRCKATPNSCEQCLRHDSEAACLLAVSAHLRSNSRIISNACWGFTDTSLISASMMKASALSPSLRHSKVARRRSKSPECGACRTSSTVRNLWDATLARSS
eukprot:3008772-Amphidinium_carterae.2